ncbi:MAG: cytochrome c peroxidase [Mariprofundus sp.]
MFIWLMLTPSAQAQELSLEPIQPIPLALHIDPDRAALGKSLFFDRRLSADNSISCAHCHDLENKGGADGLKHSFGVEGREGLVNSPTVFNAALNFSQFWDGRAATLEDQIEGPLTAHAEMAGAWPDIIRKLSLDRAFAQHFTAAYAEGFTPANIKNAIATFERTLITPDSRFDRYLNGDASAINADEKKGYALFKSYGCVACHQGRNVGGNLYQTLGVMHDYFEDFPMENNASLGRFNVTGNKMDSHRFKVPSLRLVVLTAPYFHNGREKTLAGTIRTMAKYQLGRTIPDADIISIIRFLYTLPGRWQGQSLEPTDQRWLTGTEPSLPHAAPETGKGDHS